MPCSYCGQSYPAPVPPHDDTSAPSASNSSTGGAAFQIDRVSFGCSVDGRCVIHTWSRESTATPATAPMIHRLGSGFGQNGSTLNVGTSLDMLGLGEDGAVLHASATAAHATR